MQNNEQEQFLYLLKILRKLRSPDGCEWDKAQTSESLIPYMLEEAYEVIEAIEKNDYTGLKEELGDLCLHILFQAELAKENNKFDIGDSLDFISTKLINRHPKIFNPEADQNKSWEEQKKEEKDRNSVLEGIPLALPALTRSQRMQEKAAGVGFDWSNIQDIWSKIDEEMDELRDAQKNNNIENIKEEIGDVLFTVVNLARYLGIDAESSLRKTISKFEFRFKKIESYFDDKKKKLNDVSLNDMDEIWEKAKQEQ